MRIAIATAASLLLLMSPAAEADSPGRVASTSTYAAQCQSNGICAFVQVIREEFSWTDGVRTTLFFTVYDETGALIDSFWGLIENGLFRVNNDLLVATLNHARAQVTWEADRDGDMRKSSINSTERLTDPETGIQTTYRLTEQETTRWGTAAGQVGLFALEANPAGGWAFASTSDRRTRSQTK